MARETKEQKIARINEGLRLEEEANALFRAGLPVRIANIKKLAESMKQDFKVQIDILDDGSPDLSIAYIGDRADHYFDSQLNLNSNEYSVRYTEEYLAEFQTELTRKMHRREIANTIVAGLADEEMLALKENIHLLG